MKLRRSVSLPTVAVAVLAISLGSVGTATAGGLTKGAVRKIAAKVVAKQAPGLSVAHAASAATATTATSAASAQNASALAGQPPVAYQDNATRYTYLMAAPGTQFITPIPVGAGSYAVSFDSLLSGSGSDTVNCEVVTLDGSGTLGSFFAASTNQVSTSAGTAISGAGSGTVRPGDTLYLGCGSAHGVSFSTVSAFPTAVTVTPLDSLTAGGALPSSTSVRPLVTLGGSLRR